MLFPTKAKHLKSNLLNNPVQHMHNSIGTKVLSIPSFKYIQSLTVEPCRCLYKNEATLCRRAKTLI